MRGWLWISTCTPALTPALWPPPDRLSNLTGEAVSCLALSLRDGDLRNLVPIPCPTAARVHPLIPRMNHFSTCLSPYLVLPGYVPT